MSTAPRDYYETLGVPRDATLEAIKSANAALGDRYLDLAAERLAKRAVELLSAGETRGSERP